MLRSAYAKIVPHRRAGRVAQLMQMPVEQIWLPGKRRVVVQARSLLCFWSVREPGVSMTALSNILNQISKEAKMINKIIRGYSNWEIVAFIIIDKLIVGNNRHFRRSEIMTMDNLRLAEILTAALGHKRKPKHPEETLQKTLQNLRDKGFIDFLGNGEYKLTDTGFETAKMMGQKYPYNQLMKEVKK